MSRNLHGSTQQRLELWGKIREKRDVREAYEYLLRCYFAVKKRGNAETSGQLHGAGGTQGGDYDALRSTVAALISDCRRRGVKHGPAKYRPIGIVAGTFAPRNQVKGLIPGEPTTLVPELQRFSQKWGLIFPIPPSFPEMLEQVFTTGANFVHPVRIQDQEQDLVLGIRLGLPKKLLLAFVDGALRHFVPHTRNWKTRSRKRPESVKSIITTVSQKSVRVRIPLRDGRVPFHKATLLRLIGKQMPSSPFSLRPRKVESRQLIQVADHLRLDRLGRGPRLTHREIAKKVLPNAPTTYLVRDREKRFLQLRTMLKI
jgi:hypothetical protein